MDKIGYTKDILYTEIKEKPKMSDNISSNKTIAKNTLLLYVRMLFSMLVGLYTSRVVLQVLGVEDYGVYNVVGGVVGMMGFLNSTMSGATSRFLTFELGKGDAKRISITFNSALVVHIAIALIVLLVAETVGLWFVHNKIVIPEGRMEAALWIYQFSILTALVNITQVPYNATIIAHEKMDVWAYVEIVHTLLKLLIVYLLLISSYDKLIVYGALSLAVSLLIAFYYRYYSVRHFEEAHFQLKIDKSIVKEMLSFSGYNLFGNFGYVVNAQGTNIIINNFFGVVYNAASGIAFTVSNVVSNFANTISTVFRPPIIKDYAQNNYQEMQHLVIMALTLSLYVSSLVGIPAIAEMDTLLNLWLVEVPDGASIFAKLIIVSLIFQFVRHIMIICIHATGRVRKVSMINGIIMTANPVLLFILYQYIHKVALAFVLMVVLEFILLSISIIIACKLISSLSRTKIVITLIKSFLVFAITCIVALVECNYIPSNILRILLTTIITSFFLSFQTYCFNLNKEQRQLVNQYVKATYKKYIYRHNNTDYGK